jgi:hypothetical protein
VSEAAVWLIYASAAAPAFLLRWLLRCNGSLCCLAAAVWSAAGILVIAVVEHADIADPWTGIAIFIAMGFGAMAGAIGLGAAIWFE